MDNKIYFNSALFDKDIFNNNGNSNKRYLYLQNSTIKKPSFSSQKSPFSSELESNPIKNKFESSKNSKYIKERINYYKLHPFHPPNLKIVGEDVKRKLFFKKSSLTNDKKNFLMDKIRKLTAVEKNKNKIDNEENNINNNNEAIKKDEEDDDDNKINIELVEIHKKKKKKKKIKETKEKQDKSTKLSIKNRKLKRIKNLCDSNDDDESEEGDEESDYVINPEKKIIVIFDLLLIIFFIFYFITTTIYLCIEKCFCSSNINKINFLDIFLFLNDFIFIVDMILSFFRCYYNYNFKLVKSNKLILTNYLKYDFIFDFLGAIPIYSISKYICIIKGVHEQCFQYQMSTNFLLLKLFSLFKGAKAKKLFDYRKNQALRNFLELLSENYTIERFFIILIKTLQYIGIFHFFVCLHIFVGTHSYSNWLILTGAQNESFYHLYITSSYFIITTLTTVGYGDITCQSLLERIFQIIILAIGSVFYPFVVSSIGNFIRNDSNAKIKQQNDLTMLENIRRDYPNISFKLYNKIYKYLESKCYTLEKYDVNSLIESLPFALKNNILFTMYKTTITNFKFFKKNNNSVFIAEVLNNFIPSVSKKNEFLAFEGEILEEIYFIKDGTISLNAALNTENPLKSINKYFNDNFSPFTTEEEKKLIDENMNNKSYFTAIGDITYDKAKNKINNAFKTIRNERVAGEKSQFQIQEQADKNENNNNINNNFDFKGGTITNDEGNYQYLKILDIRKNEHFGCVFMTLNKPCPLSLQVKSKIAELYLLKKEQAVNLSKSYPNIWRKIYSKEFHNLRSIKKMTFDVLRNYIEINDLLINNNIEEMAMTNDISHIDVNMFEKSVIDKTKRTSQERHSSLSKNDMLKNNTLNYEYDKKPKKLNLDAIKVNLKSKKINKNLFLKRKSTLDEKQVQFLTKKNYSPPLFSKVSKGSSKFFSSFKSHFKSNKENISTRYSEEKIRIKRMKLRHLQNFLIECKKFFNNNNKLIKEASTFRSNKSITPERKNLQNQQFLFKKSCLRKKHSPIDDIKHQMFIQNDNKRNNLSTKNVLFDFHNSKEKQIKSHLSVNTFSHLNQFKSNEQIIQSLKDMCEKESDFSFCSTNDEEYYNTNLLSMERRANFEICSSYPNLNHITKGRYIRDNNMQKKIKLILKKNYLSNKDTNINESLSPKTITFSSGFESTCRFAEYEKIKSKLESKNKKIKKSNNKSSSVNKKKIEKYKSVKRPNKFKNLNKQKNFDKVINETEIKNLNSLTTKKLSTKEGETKNNYELFSTYKISDKFSESESNKSKGTNSLKVNKSKTSSSISNEFSKKSSKNRHIKDSIDIDIKRDANIFDNTEVEYVFDRGNNNKSKNNDIYYDKNSNKNMNNNKIYKKRNKNKNKHDKNIFINDRNKELINQVLGINIPNSNLITNNIITTTSNMKSNQELDKISIYNIIQKNINKNLNIIDNKENSPPRKYSREFCCIT